ncbi:MAG: hypothetical protein AAF356_01135 [Planctomycetota bacterium]
MDQAVLDGAALLQRAESLIDDALRSDDTATRRALAQRAGAFYRGVQMSGVRSAGVHRATAHAEWLAGDDGRAVLELRRAERLDPTDRRTRDGLRALRAQVGAASHGGAGDAWWLRWRGVLPRETLLWSAAGAWALAWGAMAASVVARRWVWATRWTAGVLSALALACGGLLLLDRVALMDDANVVVVRSSAALSGPSDAVYEAVHEEPLPAGWEGRVLETRDGWARVALRGLDEAWLPLDAIESIGGASGGTLGKPE